MMRLLHVALRSEEDVVLARQRAREVARLLQFDTQDQARIATAVSELARSAATHAAGGQVDFLVDGETAPQVLVVRVSGAAFRGLKASRGVTAGQGTESLSGVTGARRLMDRFEIGGGDAEPTAILTKVFPPGARVLGARQLTRLAEELAESVRRSSGLLDELKQQNRELADTLQQLQERERELTRLNAELFDTNRGVLALYAELDEKADHLRRADQLKTKFLSNMSHEFRTPLNSILALTRILTDRIDGDLAAEQERQVGFISKSALELLELVNDLLDLAKVEAGKIVVRPADFEIEALFSTLRGMLRPLLLSPHVALRFDDAADLPAVYGDEGKVAQILRNFLSNALKFTEHGEIRVSARTDATEAGGVVLCVADTGIGIAAEDQERIFEEFAQIDNRLQSRVRGTGLGLPLCRKLAEVLQARIWVESAPGVGSKFYLYLPLRYGEPAAEEALAEQVSEAPVSLPVLLVEDRVEDRAIVESCLRNSAFSVLAADRMSRATELLATVTPAAAVLDIALQGEDTWRFVPQLKQLDIPVVVVSTVDERRKGWTLGVDAWAVKPITRDWLLQTLSRLVVSTQVRRVLIIEDDEGSRAALQTLLKPLCREILVAATAAEAMALLRGSVPDLAIVDVRLPDMNGLDLIDVVRGEPLHDALSLIVCTSLELSAEERRRLEQHGARLLPKSALTPEDLLQAVLCALAHTRAARLMRPDLQTPRLAG